MSRASLYQLDLGAQYGTWEWDLATDESAWSDELYAIIALSPETALPGQTAYASALHPDDVARVAGALDRVRRDGVRVELEHRVRLADKTMRFVRMRAWRSTDARRMHALVEDITQHSPISDRLASVGAFAAGVAHEINNPLGFLSANLELIGSELAAIEKPEPSELDTLLREAHHGIHRIHTVVRGLMTFSRIEPSHREPLDLNRVLDVAINIAHNEIRARAKLVRNFKPLPMVEGNAAVLGQVFVNLLLNAAQAIPSGNAIDHEIAISTRVDAAANVVIEVRDTGRGIPRAVGSKVFEAFVTTKPAGAGLGLSVCRNLVHAAGGDIAFESEPGKTVFRVVLPSTEPTRGPIAPPVEATRRGSVLIVDDEPIFASSLRRLLGREHDVSVAHDGHEALARFRAGERFDAVVSDLMMPGMGGMALFDAVVELAIEQAQRFVFVSAGSTGAVEFLARITNPWFDKPCDLDALRATLRRLVG